MLELILVAFACLLIGFVIGWCYHVTIADNREPAPAPQPIVVPPATVEIVNTPFGKPRGKRIDLKLVSGSGRRELGVYTCEDNRRPSSVTARAADGTLSNFVASHQDVRGQWVYRRVGVERES